MALSLSRLTRVLAVGLHLFGGGAAAQSHWNLPADVSDRNATVRVAVEAGGETVQGTVRSLSGKMWLADPRDPTTLRAQLEVPAAGIETGNPARDLQLRALLGVLGGAGAQVDLHADGKACFPGYVDRGRPCEGTLRGDVAFRGMRRPITVPFTISRNGPRYQVEGRLTVPGSAFMLGDQLSLLLGFLKQVTVAYTCVL